MLPLIEALLQSSRRTNALSLLLLCIVLTTVSSRKGNNPDSIHVWKRPLYCFMNFIVARNARQFLCSGRPLIFIFNGFGLKFIHTKRNNCLKSTAIYCTFLVQSRIESPLCSVRSGCCKLLLECKPVHLISRKIVAFQII